MVLLTGEYEAESSFRNTGMCTVISMNACSDLYHNILDFLCAHVFQC